MSNECDCSDEFEPCDEHCELLVMREGSAVRTADELNILFCREAVDLGAFLTPDETVELDEIEAKCDRWLDDLELADALIDLADRVECRLPDGVLVYFEDGYRIVRVTGGRFYEEVTASEVETAAS